MQQANVGELNQLIDDIGKFRHSTEYLEMLGFVAKFPRLAPYNAMLVYLQRPGCSHLLSVAHWQKYYGRTVISRAAPLVIMKAFGPVEFVFDVADTRTVDGVVGSRGFVPHTELAPLSTSGKVPLGAMSRLQANCTRVGLKLEWVAHGQRHGGSIRRLKEPELMVSGKTTVGIRREIRLNENLDQGAQFATLVHELGHYFCGHTGGVSNSPPRGGASRQSLEAKSMYIPDRSKLKHVEVELEAESVAWLVCKRLGIDNPSARYLFGHLQSHTELPAINVDLVLTAVNRVEQMLLGRVPVPSCFKV